MQNQVLQKTSFQRMRMFLSKTGGSSKFLLVSVFRYLFSSNEKTFIYWWLAQALPNIGGLCWLKNIGGLCWLCISISINTSVHTLSFSIKRLILFYIIIFHKKPVLTSCMYLFYPFSKSFVPFLMSSKISCFNLKHSFQIICSQ